MIHTEVKHARRGKPARIIAKMNSLSDGDIISELYEAARAGVEIKLIIRGVFCLLTDSQKFLKPIQAISIIDEYLEHARVWIFHNGGKDKVFISSADWMIRNMEHRVEATCPILHEELKQELMDIINIQLRDNVKARWLDNDLSNEYVHSEDEKIRSQVETYNFLKSKIEVLEISSH
jgi:polyphosphate kinase